MATANTYTTALATELPEIVVTKTISTPSSSSWTESTIINDNRGSCRAEFIAIIGGLSTITALSADAVKFTLDGLSSTMVACPVTPVTRIAGKFPMYCINE